MGFYPRNTALTTLAVLWFMIQTTHGVINLQFYSVANCGGSVSAVCGNLAEGQCCGTSTRLWGSVQAVNPPPCFFFNTYGTVGQGNGAANTGCNIVLGRGAPCYSTSLNAIQGGYWYTISVCEDSDSSTEITRDIGDEMLPPISTECKPIDLLNYEENGTNYQLYANGTKYAELMASEAATNDDEMGKFIKEHADKIVEGSI